MSGSSPPGELADLRAEPLPLLRVLGGLVLPEPVALGVAVDDQLRAHVAADLGLLLRGDDADRGGAAVEGELGGVGAEAAGGAPDQHDVALLHVGAVLAHQLAVGGGVDQAGDAASSQVRWSGFGPIRLVGLDQGQLGEAAEVGLEAPDALLRVHHRVRVPVRALQLDREAVRDDLVAGLPGVDAGAGPHDDAGEVGADHVVGQVVPLGQRRELAVALEEAERRDGLEDRGPDGVVVDRAGHHGHERLTGAELGDRDVLDAQALARVLLLGGQTLEHVHVLGADGDAPIVLGNLQASDVGELPGEDGVADVLHCWPPMATLSGESGGSPDGAWDTASYCVVS